MYFPVTQVSHTIAKASARTHAHSACNHPALCTIGYMTEMWTLEQIKMSVGGKNIWLDERREKRQYIFFRVLHTRHRHTHFLDPTWFVRLLVPLEMANDKQSEAVKQWLTSSQNQPKQNKQGNYCNSHYTSSPC